MILRVLLFLLIVVIPRVASAQVVDLALGDFLEPADLFEGQSVAPGQEVRMAEGSILWLRYDVMRSDGHLCKVFVVATENFVVDDVESVDCVSDTSISSIDRDVENGESFVYRMAFVGELDVESYEYENREEVQSDDNPKSGLWPSFGRQTKANFTDLKQRLKSRQARLERAPSATAAPAAGRTKTQFLQGVCKIGC